MRNYALHCELPVQSIALNARVADRATGREEYSLTLALDPARLLEQYAEWGAPVTRDFRQATGLIDLSACLAEALDRLDQLMDWLILEDREVLVESAAFILRFHELEGGDRMPMICRFARREDGETIRIHLTEPSLYVAAHLMERLGKGRVAR